MIKKIFWTLIILMMLGVGTIAGGLIFITNSDLNQWKKTIEEFAYQQTGRKLSIDGQLDLTLSMQPHLMVEKLRLQSPDWSEHENDIEIEHLKIQLGFSNIFSGIIDILNIEAKNIYVLVETKQSSHNDFGFIESASQNTTNENPQSDQHQSLNFFDWKKLSNHMFGFFPLVHHAILSDITVEILNHQNSIHENFLLNRVHLVKHDNNHSLMDTLIDLSFKGQDVKLVGFISSPSSILKNQPWSVELEGSLANSRTYVKGFINDLKNLSGVDFKFLLNTENIEHLIKLFNQTLPLQGFMSLEASINDDNALQELFVEQLKFILGDEHAPLKANLESQINLAQQPSIELSGLIELSDIRELNQWNNWLGFKLPLMPDLGKSRLEIAMQATELDSKIPTVNIDAFKFEIDHLKHIIHLEIDGQISDVLSPQMRSLDAELELFAAEASTIATELKPWMIFSGFDLSNLSIPSLGALEFKTSINGSGDTLSGYGLDHFDLTIGDERHLWVAAKGSVGALGADGFMQGDLNFYSADLNLLQPLTGISFTKPTQASTQFDINGRIGKDMNLNPLNLQIANTDLSGRVSIDTVASTPLLSVDLVSQNIDSELFNILFLKPQKNQTSNSSTTPNTQTENQPDQYLFSDQPFDLSPLALLKGNISLKGDQITLSPNQTIGPFEIIVDVDHDYLSLSHLEIFNQDDGFLKANARFEKISTEPSDPSANLSLQLTSSQFSIAPILELSNIPDVMNGDIASEINLYTSGQSLSEMAGSLNGSVNLTGQNLKLDVVSLLQNQHLKSFLSTLFSSVVADGFQNLCLLSGVIFNDGIADIDFMEIAIDSAELSALGQINLSAETFDIDALTTAQVVNIIKVKTPLHLSGSFIKPLFSFPRQPADLDWNKLSNGTTTLKPLYPDGPQVTCFKTPQNINQQIPSNDSNLETVPEKLEKKLKQNIDKLGKKLLKGLF